MTKILAGSFKRQDLGLIADDGASKASPATTLSSGVENRRHAEGARPDVGRNLGRGESERGPESGLSRSSVRPVQFTFSGVVDRHEAVVSRWRMMSPLGDNRPVGATDAGISRGHRITPGNAGYLEPTCYVSPSREYYLPAEFTF